MTTGYLREKDDIKYFILFAMSQLPFPVGEPDLLDICLIDAAFGYFEFSEAFAELQSTGHVRRLEDEEGKEHTFEVIDALDYKEVRYMALVPYVADEASLHEDLQMIIMKVGEDEEGEFMDIVEDDEELLEVSKAFEKRLEDFFDIQS